MLQPRSLVRCQDNQLWPGYFRKFEDLGGECSTDWRYRFLQDSVVLTDLRCFFTHKTFKDNLHVVPITFTRTGSTGRANFIHSTTDLLSLEAFKRSHVRKSVWGEDFSLWLPLYFTRQRFVRALPFLQQCLTEICSPPQSKARGKPLPYTRT